MARLNYVAYPQSFAEKLDLPPAGTTRISSTHHTLTVAPPAAR